MQIPTLTSTRLWTRCVFVGATALWMGCTGRVEGTSQGGSGNVTDPPGGGTGPGGGNTGGTGNRPAPSTGLLPCIPGVPATSQLTRLTRTQYDNTVRDLFGTNLIQASATLPSSMLAPDTPGSVDQRAWDGYKSASSSLAALVMGDATARAKAIPCTPTGDGAACAQQFIQQFGRLAFRRPLTTEELARFTALYTNRATLTATGTFNEAAQLILQGFLVSPSFLTRAEISETPDSGNFVLNGYEVASRLSYMLWGSMPDETLFSAASAGTLATTAGVLAQAQRMMKDPKARAKIGDFHQTYAHMGLGTRWEDIARDPAVYPAFKPAMTPMLSDETSRFFDYIVFEKGGSFRDLMTSPVGFVNATLAPLYGLNPASYGADLVPVNLDPATRSGVFTRLGFLTSYSVYNRPSPILRGAFLQKEVLCTTIGAPPPDAQSTPLPMTGTTNRERVTAQTSSGVCASCHTTLINPTGFALEGYDAIGAYQPTEAGMPTDTTATVRIGPTSVPVTNAVDLMNKIADSPEAQQCYAQKLAQFAYDRALTAQDSCTVQSLAGKMTQPTYTVVSLMTDLTQTTSFRYRAKELAP
jgi:hypothetical protein